MFDSSSSIFCVAASAVLPAHAVWAEEAPAKLLFGAEPLPADSGYLVGRGIGSLDPAVDGRDHRGRGLDRSTQRSRDASPDTSITSE